MFLSNGHFLKGAATGKENGKRGRRLRGHPGIDALTHVSVLLLPRGSVSLLLRPFRGLSASENHQKQGDLLVLPTGPQVPFLENFVMGSHSFWVYHKEQKRLCMICAGHQLPQVRCQAPHSANGWGRSPLLHCPRPALTVSVFVPDPRTLPDHRRLTGLLSSQAGSNRKL